jgi:C_GCAxxG_C_C family probable redox protein
VAKCDDAVKEFKCGLNCAQAILVTYGPERGLDRETSIRLGSSLGGGVGHTGRICGAASGACIILGLAYCSGPGRADRDKPLQESARLLDEFAARLGTVDCIQILGRSIRTQEELVAARESGIFAQKCPGCVRTAAEILESILG